MKQDPPTIQRASAPVRPPTEPVRKPMLMIAGLLVVVCIGAGIFLANRKTAPSASAADPSLAQDPSTPGGKVAANPDEEVKETTGTAVGNQPPPSPVSVPVGKHTAAADSAVPRVEPSAATRQMVTGLTQLDLSQGPLTPEKAAAWKQNLQQLTSQGAAAVPAIREFLEKNLDLPFDNTSAGLLGQSTLRLSLLESLQNIGGAEALGVSSQILQTTLDPKEIAWLAQSLEQQMPGQYGQMAADAALEALQMASAGKLEGHDVGPLFNVLQKFGGDEAVSELEKFSSQYRYYATIALANLPQGEGISALVQMVQDADALSKGGRAPALQMLAQAALQSPEALLALTEQARLNQIPSSTWLNIAAILGGDKMEIGTAPVESGVRSFHLASGNQNFFTVPDRSPWTQEQVDNNLKIIDQLTAVAGNNTTAMTALQNARNAVQAHLQGAAPN